MSEIKLDSTKLTELIEELKELVTKTDENTGYVTDNLFQESGGKSTEMLNATLASLVTCANDISLIVTYTKQYFNHIIVGFKEEDERLAKLN